MTISAPQLGKTVVLGAWLLGSMWQHGPSTIPWWWTAPTYAQVQDGFLTKFVGLARAAGVLKSVNRTPPMRADLVNGSWVEARSWERPENLYGRTILGGVVDEFGWLTDPAYAAISSRRAETRGPLRYAGNVGEIGGVAESLWRRAESGEAGFACRRWTWRDRALAHDCACGEIPIEVGASGRHREECGRGQYTGFIEGEARRLPGPMFRQLYEAEWVDWNTLPAYDFDRSVHVSAEAEFQVGLPVDVSCDFNVSPMAWVLGQHKGLEAWAFDEIAIEGRADTRIAASLLVSKLAALPTKNVNLVVYGDASGKSTDTRSKTTDYDLIRDMVGPNVLGLRFEVPAANPPVASRLNAVNGKLRSASGEVTYRVHPRCTELADDFARTGLKPGTRDLDKTDKRRTHYTDAEGYRLVTLYPVEEAPRMTVSTSSSYRAPVATMQQAAF